MRPEATDTIHVHPEPARRGTSNVIIAAYLGDESGQREWEQLWGQRSSDDTATLCCIPYFVHDLSIGDTVRFDSDYMIVGLVARGSEVSFRVWFGEPYATPIAVRDRVVDYVMTLGGAHEHLGADRLAVAAPTEEKGSQLSGFLMSLEANGQLVYETARS